jgi:5-methylcytosine-specific restriction endonuclease McrA
MSAYRFAKNLIKKTTKRATAKTVRTKDYGAAWDKLSKECLRLAGYKCKLCSERANRAHHLIPLSKGGTNTLINLIAVCSDCHKKYHRHLR